MWEWILDKLRGLLFPGDTAEEDAAREFDEDEEDDEDEEEDDDFVV